jgi:dTDP-4-dehydrorhamnose reductase
MTRWLVTGAGGMLGRDLVSVLASIPGAAVAAATRATLDITDPHAVAAAVAGHDVVVNAAAWTDVDGAEMHETQATAINGDAVAALAHSCAAAGAHLLHVSTDYVFSGDATRPYHEDAPTAPVNAYGRGKLVGERAVLASSGYVVRTAWLYGAHGRNFVATMLRLATERETVEVVDDQLGQPTWTGALAAQVVELGQAALGGTAPPGVYHGTASGQTSWFGLARELFALAGLDPDRVRRTTTDNFPRPARRPAYSVLSHDGWAAAGLTPMADWRPMLKQALAHPDFAAAIPSTSHTRKGAS